MSRRQKVPGAHQVTVHLSPELSIAVDNFAIGLGLENRAAAIAVLIQAGMSSIPLDAAIGVVMAQAVRSVKKTEFEELARHFEERARLYRSAAS